MYKTLQGHCTVNYQLPVGIVLNNIHQMNQVNEL